MPVLFFRNASPIVNTWSAPNQNPFIRGVLEQEKRWVGTQRGKFLENRQHAVLTVSCCRAIVNGMHATVTGISRNTSHSVSSPPGSLKTTPITKMHFRRKRGKNYLVEVSIIVITPIRVSSHLNSNKWKYFMHQIWIETDWCVRQPAKVHNLWQKLSMLFRHSDILTVELGGAQLCWWDSDSWVRCKQNVLNWMRPGKKKGKRGGGGVCPGNVELDFCQIWVPRFLNVRSSAPYYFVTLLGLRFTVTG